MGRSRFLHGCLIAAALVLAACGGGDDDLLVAGDMSIFEGDGGGGSNYVTSGGGVGSIVGRVTFDGRAWTLKPLDLTTEDGFCVNANSPNGMMPEDFLVGPDGGLQGVIVYIDQGLTGRFETPTEPLVIDQRNCRYIPHIAVVRAGQPVIVKSSDNTNHNVHGGRGPNGEFNNAMARPGELPPKVFKKKEVAKRIWCDVHGWMETYLAVLPHPCYAITGPDGSFVIENVPAGNFKLAAWHEKKELGEVAQDVTVKPGEATSVEFKFERK